MSFKEIFYSYDDGSQCIDICEFKQFYHCHKDENGWSDFNDGILTGYFQHFEDDSDGDCCLNYEEFGMAVDGLGGFKEECDLEADQCEEVNLDECYASTLDWTLVQIFQKHGWKDGEECMSFCEFKHMYKCY
jgi:hypothetical protein